MKAKEFNDCLNDIRNVECFNKIYKEYYPLIIKFVVRHFNDVNLGKDIAHDIFTDLLQRKIDYVKNPNAYIFTAAHNLAIKYKSENGNISLENNETYSVFDAFDKTEINFAIQRLSGEEREIIELKWLFGYDLKEIAEMKGCSLFGIQKRHQRILKKLRKILK